jgi:HD-GYP domain-containing protein (c-di-GMP phosphodiesterase class II)
MDPESLEGLQAENRALRKKAEGLEKQAEAQRENTVRMLKLLEAKNEQIETSLHKLEEAHEELRGAYEQTIRYYLNTVRGMASALEARNQYLRFHSSQVAKCARSLGREMGLADEEVECLEIGGLLHDFGNIGVRVEILNKEGNLTPEEYEHVKTHTTAAEKILEPIGKLETVVKYIRHHHERMDGKGYPDGLKGAQIPLGARILAICEAFVAMTSERPHRHALDRDNALQELLRGAGTQFDPTLVPRFVGLVRRGGTAGPPRSGAAPAGGAPRPG